MFGGDSSLWLSRTQLQICLVLPSSNPSSAYLLMQAADYPGSRHFIKERLKSTNYHMLKIRASLVNVVHSSSQLMYQSRASAGTKPRWAVRK